MMQSLASEKYKGVSISIVKKILPSSTIVYASMKLKGKLGKVSAPTKEMAVVKAKQWINRII